MHVDTLRATHLFDSRTRHPPHFSALRHQTPLQNLAIHHMLVSPGGVREMFAFVSQVQPGGRERREAGRRMRCILAPPLLDCVPLCSAWFPILPASNLLNFSNVMRRLFAVWRVGKAKREGSRDGNGDSQSYQIDEITCAEQQGGGSKKARSGTSSCRQTQRSFSHVRTVSRPLRQAANVSYTNAARPPFPSWRLLHPARP